MAEQKDESADVAEDVMPTESKLNDNDMAHLAADAFLAERMNIIARAALRWCANKVAAR